MHRRTILASIAACITAPLAFLLPRKPLLTRDDIAPVEFWTMTVGNRKPRFVQRLIFPGPQPDLVGATLEVDGKPVGTIHSIESVTHSQDESTYIVGLRVPDQPANAAQDRKRTSA